MRREQQLHNAEPRLGPHRGKHARKSCDMVIVIFGAIHSSIIAEIWTIVHSNELFDIFTRLISIIALWRFTLAGKFK